MEKIELTGNIEVRGAGAANTAYRDENGNFHAQWFEGVMRYTPKGSARPEYYKFRLDPNQAEEIGNESSFATWKTILVPRTVVDASGQTVEDIYVNELSGTITRTMILENCEPVKLPAVRSGRRYIQFIEIPREPAATQTTMKRVEAADGTTVAPTVAAVATAPAEAAPAAAPAVEQ